MRTTSQTKQALTVNLQYQPHDRQAPFHRDRYHVFARLVSTGTGGGKTLAGAYECLLWALENPGSVGYAFEPTYKMVRRNLLPAFESSWLLGAPLESNPLVQEFNQTDSRITFKNGSQLWLIGLEDPESAEGPNVDWIWSDESRLIHHFETAWQVWMRRLRGSGPSTHVGIWLTTTPDFPGSPLHQKFEDPRAKLPNSKVYRWTIDDNPWLSEAYKEEVRRSHSGGMAERFVLGRFAAVSAGTFDFDYIRHVLAPELIPRQKFRDVRYGVDFGWTNPLAVVAIGLDGDGRAYVFEEFYAPRVRTETLIAEAQEMQRRHGRGPFLCDRSEPATIQELQRSGLAARADKSKRDDGIREMGSRFQNGGDGRPRLFVSSACVNLISELQSYSAERKEDDHAIDALRYALMGTARAAPPTVSFGKVVVEGDRRG